MDWLTFLSKIVEALAWPIVAVVAICSLRGRLSNLLSDLKLSQFKYKDAELTFLSTLESSKNMVIAEKEEIRQELENEELPPEKRAEVTTRFEDAVKRENTLTNIASTLASHHRRYREAPHYVFYEILKNAIGLPVVLSLSEEELMIQSRSWIKNIEQGNYQKFPLIAVRARMSKKIPVTFNLQPCRSPLYVGLLSASGMNPSAESARITPRSRKLLLKPTVY